MPGDERVNVYDQDADEPVDDVSEAEVEFDERYLDDAPLGPRPISFLVLLAGVIAASLIVGSVFLERVGSASVDGAPTLVEVRGLVGVSSERAVNLLTDDGFEVSIVEMQNESVPPGVVIHQRPLAGERIEVGSTVELTVSAGDDFTIVPDIRGSPEEELDILLITHGLGRGEVTYREDDRAVDEIIDQDPAPGELVPRGSTVAVVLSSGPPMVEIPDVRNLPQEEAVKVLRDAGFVVAVDDRRSYSVRRGHAMSTDPEDEAPRGSRIVLYVSSGAPPATTAPPTSEPPGDDGGGGGGGEEEGGGGGDTTTPTTSPGGERPSPGGGGPGGGGPGGGGPGGGGPGGGGPGGGPGGT